MIPKDVRSPVARACVCVTLHDSRDFADVIRPRILRWGLPWIILGGPTEAQGSLEQGGGSVRERDVTTKQRSESEKDLWVLPFRLQKRRDVLHAKGRQMASRSRKVQGTDSP